MVTTNQKSVIDIYTEKKDKSKYNTKDSHQVTRKKKSKQKLPTKNNPKTINKMSTRTYISIITLNVNGLNATIKRQWLNG